MQIGMIGLGRMGANMARRLTRNGHACVVYDADPAAVSAAAQDGARGVASVAELVGALTPPRAVWLMLPVPVVEAVLESLTPHLEAGDVVIDGGNSPFESAIRRAAALAPSGIHFVDAGTSGGVWGLERGYCLMIGGHREAVARLEPVFSALAPGASGIAPVDGRDAGDPASRGYLHCGPPGAGHFVKMVHNGIEYGLMAAYAEGFNLLRHAGKGQQEGVAGRPAGRLAGQGATEQESYDFDLGAIAELWRRGSVITSWLLDLSAASLARDPGLAAFRGHVGDSGEGRWALKAAIDAAVPVPVLSAALYSRFESRGQADFANRLLSAMRQQFGGHQEQGPAP